MWTLRTGLWVGVVVMSMGLVVACSPPPPPSAETAALEDALLTVEDVGGEFTEEYRGQVGVSGGGLCPESTFRFSDVGMVRANFRGPLGDDDQVDLTEMMYVVEPGGITTLMSDLKAGYEACDGVVWTDYGTTQTVEIIDAPAIGDDRLAIRRIEGEPPFEGEVTETTTLYVCEGDVFVEISTDVRSVGSDEFERIASVAIDKLPD